MNGVRRPKLVGVLLSFGAALIVAAFVGPLGALAQSGGPEEIADEVKQGPAAIEEIDVTPAEAADRNGMSEAELTAILANDDTAWIDADGRLLYVEPAFEEPLVVAGPEEVPVPAPLSDTFKLHSRPGSNRVIYLDFDGHDAAGSIWAQGRSDTYAEPWSQDGNGSSFNDSERRLIQEVWRRVAEDYAPFDVDVTTEDPGQDRIRRSGSADQQYGTRVAFSPNIIYTCTCGGVAYVNVFNLTSQHDYYQPAWVVAASNRSAKALAEAASHEAGHNLSLRHDGTSEVGYYGGHGDWAPIMGVGYYRTLSQWSRGEYAGANNQEDDVAKMKTAGVPAVPDDHGDGVSGGTPLTSDTVDVSGIISSRGDKDAFTFSTSGGQVSVTVAGVGDGPNLDPSLTLVNSSGSTVSASNPAGLTATINTTVGAGTYALVVDGVGAGDPATTGYSDYGSLGFYTLTGTAPVSTNPPPSCGGLSQEAEGGVLFGRFVVGQESSASGGSYVAVPRGSGHNYDGVGRTDSRVDVCFDVAEAGTYRIDARVKGVDWESDSFFVRVDGGPVEGYLWDTTRSSGYQVDSVSDRDGADPVTVSLSAGEHTVSFYLREADTRLDTVSLVKVGGSGPSCGGLSQEAEGGVLFGRFVVGQESSASGGSYVAVPRGSGHNYDGVGRTDSRVDVCFDVAEAGTYRIDARVKGVDWESDSFFVRVDGGPVEGYLWDTTRSSGYQVDSVSDRDGADPVTVSLSAGEHTVSFYLREADTRLDTVSLVKVGGSGPSCGGLSQEAEGGVLFGRFVVGQESSASGGSYVAVPRGSGHNYDGVGRTDSRVDVCFDVAEAGTYRIDARVKGVDWESDSFFVRVDGGPVEGYLWDTTRSSGYQVDSVSDRDGADPVTVSLSAGEHTVSFYLREADTRLDTVSLVKTG